VIKMIPTPAGGAVRASRPFVQANAAKWGRLVVGTLAVHSRATVAEAAAVHRASHVAAILAVVFCPRREGPDLHRRTLAALRDMRLAVFPTVPA
jgi:hypothetical protein